MIMSFFAEFRLLQQHWKASELAQRIVIELASQKGLECRGLTHEQIEEKLLMDIIDHILKRIQRELENCPEPQLHQMAQMLEQRLKDLHPKDREALYRELGLGDQSSAELLQLFRQGGVGIATISLLHSAGMGFFMALSTITHALATTMLGIVLPFSFYTGISSLSAFFLSFPGILVCGLGMGGWYWKKQKDELKIFLVSSVLLTCRSRCI